MRPRRCTRRGLAIPPMSTNCGCFGQGEIALAQIYGLRIPVAELNDRTLYRLALIDIGKAGFNPDEPRIPKGAPHAGEWTTGSSGDAGTDWSNDLSDNALLPDD